MRFVLAIMSFLLAAVLLIIGFVQRASLAENPYVTASVDAEHDAPVLVIDGEALNAYEGHQTIEITGEQVFAAYGRSSDVTAWIGDARHNRVEFDPETGGFATELVDGEETEVPNPAGSDLWYTEFSNADAVRLRINVPEDVSIIVAADGSDPAPTEITVTWPVDTSSPWTGPLLIGGAAFLLLGLVLLIWAILHVRRSRGPRRKQQKMPKTPRKRFRPSPQSSSGRRARRPFIAVPVTVLAVALAGCTPQPAQQTAEPTATAGAQGEQLPPPAVTVSQAQQIVQRVSDTAADADADRDAGIAARRFAGPALEMREANYSIRDDAPDQPAPTPVPGGPAELILPQQTESWPRAVFTVVTPEPAEGEETATEPPVALMLIQESPRENYRAYYAIDLHDTVPEVAPATVAAARLPNDVRLLKLAPEQLAGAYADVLSNGDAAEFAALFDIADDQFKAAHDQLKTESAESIGPTAEIGYSTAVGQAETIAFSTNDAGAIVAVTMSETETVRPTEAGAAVDSEEGGKVRALSGIERSQTGIAATYLMQLLFYVPPVSDEDGLIRLIGYSEELTEATEVE